MNRWATFLGAIMLVLMLWTGSAAHAAERFDCIPVMAGAEGHFDGQQEQLPSSPDQGVAHHHSGCGGHHEAAPAADGSMAIRLTDGTAPLVWREAGVPGRGPDAQLRPPIV